MGIPERKERQREDLRRQVLEAAEDLFVNDGFENVSMLEHLARLNHDFTRVLESGAPSDNEISRSYTDGYEYAPPDDLPDAYAVICVALQDWIAEIDFHPTAQQTQSTPGTV